MDNAMTSESTESKTTIQSKTESSAAGRKKAATTKAATAKKSSVKSKTKTSRAGGSLSQKAQKQQASQIPTSQLTVEDYADRPNPELSWAAAILKRSKSTDRQRKKAAEIMSRAGTERAGKKLSAYWQNLSPEARRELAARGGRRRWEIWREEQAALHGTLDGAANDGVSHNGASHDGVAHHNLNGNAHEETSS